MSERKLKPVISNINSYKSILLGLMGHVDSGKTSIAKMISEIVSTAGLDAHPQSKERGITIDLGFTSLILDDYLITLVDAPGHADLIRSVVAAANIINGAIIVIDAKEGIQIQTAEHLVILESFQILNIIIVINKIDLVSKEEVNQLENSIRKVLKNSKFNNFYQIVKVSTKLNLGKEDLILSIKNLIKEIDQKGIESKTYVPNKENEIYFPIDHYFSIKGKGVIVTGTLISGVIKKGMDLTVLPYKIPIKVKELQVYFQDVDQVSKGFRVGINISNIDLGLLRRGDFFTNNVDAFEKSELIFAIVQMNPYFKKSIKFGTQINITIGLNTFSSRIFPLYFDDDYYYKLEEVIQTKNDIGDYNSLIKIYRYSNYIEEINGRSDDIFQVKKEHINILNRDLFLSPTPFFYAYIWLNEPTYIKKEMKPLLSKLDLSPTTLRFFGIANIISILPHDFIPVFDFITIKNGKIKKIKFESKQILIEGFSSSKQGAERLIGLELEHPKGKIIGTFGNKGIVIVEVETQSLLENIKIEMEVQLKIKRKQRIDKFKTYN